MGAPLLEIEGLRTHFLSGEGRARAVDRLSLSIDAGEVVGLVGESGCGKSVTALSILRLLPEAGEIVGGTIRFDGRDLLSLSDGAMRKIRGNRISMVFQEPMTSLNPVLTCGSQIEEVLRLHQGLSRRRAAERAVELLDLAGIPDPAARFHEYPHTLSGGMRQRVLLAIALACGPSLLIADEPTTALDTTIQAQILELLRNMRERFGLAILLITHDMGVVAEMANRVAVMYAGEIVEEAKVADLFRDTLHPYTQALLRSIPKLSGERKALMHLHGSVPNPARLPSGCRFQPRCPIAEPICGEGHPPLEGREHRVRCFLSGGAESV